MPYYEYFPWLESQFPENYPFKFYEVTACYQGRTPLVWDPHHNDHSRIDIYSPHYRKRLLFIDLSGKFTSKEVLHGLGVFQDVSIFELED